MIAAEVPLILKGVKADQPRKTGDIVTRYASAVVNGKRLAGRAVRQACQRHLDDLAASKLIGSEYIFNLRAALHIIQFFGDFLTLEDGRPFLLTDWQAFCLGSLFGWQQKNGKRRFHTAYIETGKGSGKTPLLAGLGLYGLAFDGEFAAEIYSAAFDRQQASILLNDAIRMVQASPDLFELLEVGKYNLADLASGSFFRALSSEHRSKSGPRPHFALIDELHEHRDGRVVNKMRAGFKGRDQPLLVEITNAGHDRTSICWQHHEHSIELLERRIEDDQWFAYVCQLDPCERCFSEGYRQPKDGCPACDDWTDPGVWAKTNPSIGVTIQSEYLKRQVDQALAMPSDQALVKRLNFCLWTQSHTVWIPPDRWDACRVPAVATANTSRPCAAGLDLSSKLDLSAFVVALRIDDDPNAPAEDVAIETQTDDGQPTTIKLTLNFAVELVPFFWLPEETLIERVQTERIPYDVWRTQGHLRVTAGGVIDHQLVYEMIVQAWKTFRIQKLGLDERDATMMFVKLRDEARLGGNVLGIGQGRRLSEAYKLLEVLIRSRRLRHDGHPVLGWCFANAEPKHDRLGALWIEKPAEVKRIDGAVAAAMAISQLMVLPHTRASRYGVMVV